MSCPCDEFVFPTRLPISAALARLPRALGTFPDWRAAMLAAIGEQPALDDWRARDARDLGLMLTEMAAYVFDVVSFYDALTADESYLRTARLAGAHRRHVALLGYRPRPAVGSVAVLVAEADGKLVLQLPTGTAFRSGEFDGNPPQVFELTQSAALDPRINRMAVAHVRETALPSSFTSLLAQPGSVRLKAGDRVAFDFNGTLAAARIAACVPALLRSRVLATRIDFSSALTCPNPPSYARARLVKGGATAGLWSLPAQTGESAVLSGATVLLESRLPIRAGDIVLLEHGTTLLAHRVASVADELRTLLTPQTTTITDSAGKASTLVSPAIKISVTRLTLDSTPSWSAVDSTKVVVHYACADGAQLLPRIKDTLEEGDPVGVPSLIDPPRTVVRDLVLEDAHGEGVVTSGALDASAHTATLDANQDWGKTLAAPVTLHGNAFWVSRGESVQGEVLGVGDGHLPEQTFTLKKKPLTYLNAASAGGLISTLSVRVGGVSWKEAQHFYDAGEYDAIYVVRHDDEGHTHVTFGGGARLPTGAVVIADYRFGAGAAAPPAGSIKQVAKPVAGLRGVRNVLPAFGGSDAESPNELAARAPRSALLLGRAISLVDLEVAAAQVGGVLAARAAWRWDARGLRPAAIVGYIGDAQLKPSILVKLRELSEPDAPIAVERSLPQRATLHVGVKIDPDHVTENVIATVRRALFDRVTVAGSGGLLSAEKLGPDGIVFLSHVVHSVMSVPGVRGVDHIDFDSTAFTEMGRRPAAGMHFDFAQGGVWINGKAE